MNITSEITAKKFYLRNVIPKNVKNIVAGISRDGSFGWICHETSIQVIHLSDSKLISIAKFEVSINVLLIILKGEYKLLLRS